MALQFKSPPFGGFLNWRALAACPRFPAVYRRERWSFCYAQEYQAIWDNESNNIVKAINDITGLHFIENEINAVVFEGQSYSRPLQLRAS